VDWDAETGTPFKFSKELLDLAISLAVAGLEAR
jgi:hypothetical protein